MAIDAFQETVLSLSQAAKRLPKIRPGGKKIHVCALYRWMLGGLEGGDGTRVYLETIKVGGTCCTSIEALQRFFDRLSQTGPPFEPSLAGFSATRLRQIRAAERELDRAGI